MSDIGTSLKTQFQTMTQEIHKLEEPKFEESGMKSAKARIILSYWIVPRLFRFESIRGRPPGHAHVHDGNTLLM